MKHVFETLIQYTKDTINDIPTLVLDDTAKEGMVKDMMVVYNTDDRDWLRNSIEGYLDVNGYMILK
jgi:hypothetical protein